MGIRIWHQSMTDLTLLPGYAGMLHDHARRIASADTVVDLHGLAPGTYPRGMAPIELVRYRWGEHLAFVQIVENCMRAEREEYDAVAISCFLDPVLDEARSVVDIPVVSSLETALLVSSTIGRAVGLVAIDETMAVTLRELVRRYGYGDRVVNVSTIDPPITEFELDRAFAGSPELVERFTAHARGMVAGGCDVIIPAEGVVNTVLVRNKLDAVDGTPVLDSYGSLLAFAEMLVQLRRRSGLSIGRRGAYAKPPESLLRHLRRMTLGVLQDSEARLAD